MNTKIYRCLIGPFSIVEGFEIVDILFENNYLSVSCVEKNNNWYIEILSEQKILKSIIADSLEKYNYSFMECDELQNIDWLAKCFENFKPISVGNFYLFGPHLRGKIIPKNKIAIEIAAATAFGSGEHPTTNRCLIACQTFFDDRKHKRVLDIGCGSCVLSIALAKLGARNIDAYDIDSEAVKVSKENIIINKVAHRINVFQNYNNEFINSRYDFIVANILAEPLIAMSQAVISALNNSGILILSGFNAGDDSVINQYLASRKLSLKYIYQQDNWLTVVLQKSM